MQKSTNQLKMLIKSHWLWLEVRRHDLELEFKHALIRQAVFSYSRQRYAKVCF